METAVEEATSESPIGTTEASTLRRCTRSDPTARGDRAAGSTTRDLASSPNIPGGIESFHKEGESGDNLVMGRDSACQVASIRMLDASYDHDYEDQWAVVALAASVLQVAASIWTLVDFLASSHDENRKKRPHR